MAYIPPPDSGISGTSASVQGTQTVAEVFTANGWEQWWTNTGIQHFNARPGSNNCTDPGASEYGNDYNPSYKATIRSITAGTVIYAQLPPDYYTTEPNGSGHTSIGFVIQIRNGDGSLIHYQHMLSTPLQVGNNVNVGDVIGIAGGCPQGCYANNGCGCTDAWSTGPHIEVRYSSKEVAGNAPWCNGNWIDPVPVIAKIVGATAMNPIGSSASSGNNLPQFLQNLPNPFIPNGDVAQTFASIDQFLVLQSPLPPYQTVSLFGVSLPDPIMAYEFVQNLSLMFGRLILRLVILWAGVFICFKVFNHIVNVTGFVGGAVQGVAGAGALALPFI